MRKGVRIAFLLAGGEDMNGDAWPDLLVGAPSSFDAGAWAGKTCLFFGEPGMDESPDLTFPEEAVGDEVGSRLNGVGAVDLLASVDFKIGAAYHNLSVLTDAVRAYLFSGEAGLDSLPDLIFDATSYGDRLGYDVAGAERRETPSGPHNPPLAGRARDRLRRTSFNWGGYFAVHDTNQVPWSVHAKSRGPSPQAPYLVLTATVTDSG